MKRTKKKGFNPKASDLKKVQLFLVSTLELKEREEIMHQSFKFTKEHYRKLYQDFGNNPEFYFRKEWSVYGIKEALRIKAGRPVSDNYSEELTLDDFRELANCFLNLPNDATKEVMWQGILEKISSDKKQAQ